MRRVVSTLAWACLSVGLSGQVAAGPTDFVRPTYAGAYEPQGVDERGLWMALDDQERAFERSPSVVKDSSLKAFVLKVLCNTVGQDRCESTRVYIVQDNSFNASMAPNGLMIVHTGLLARLHSEAELATVLGHEFAHFELRHTLQKFRNIRAGTDILAWLTLSSAVTGVSSAQTQNSIIAGFYSFDRAQEAEADALAAKYILASPYRLTGSSVWQRLTEEENALRQERGLRKIKKRLPDLTDTHPTNDQRFKFFKSFEDQDGERGGLGIEPYRDATSVALQLIFSGLVKGNDFAATDYVIRGRGEALGWDATLLFARAELYRLRGNPRDLVTAKELYTQAISRPDAPGEAWRGLGICALRLGDTGDGQKALKEYLLRVPEAADASTIKLLVEG